MLDIQLSSAGNKESHLSSAAVKKESNSISAAKKKESKQLSAAVIKEPFQLSAAVRKEPDIPAIGQFDTARSRLASQRATSRPLLDIPNRPSVEINISETSSVQVNKEVKSPRKVVRFADHVNNIFD